MFSTIGALRSADETEIIKRFIRAYNENPDMAMKILFYARDVRGGIGERRVFRIILKFLALYNKQSLIKNIKYVGEYGRFDDLLCTAVYRLQRICYKIYKKNSLNKTLI